METYRDFHVCTRQALDFCCNVPRADLPAAARTALMDCYLALPAFDDVRAGLEQLSKARVKMYAFSNGHPDDIEQLLDNAGIDAHLDGVVSVHEVRTFKPAPAVCRHFLARAGAVPGDTWLISGNPFDICGARAAGMHALWLRRNAGAVFDPWEFTPTEITADFIKVAQRAVTPAGSRASRRQGRRIKRTSTRLPIAIRGVWMPVAPCSWTGACYTGVTAFGRGIKHGGPAAVIVWSVPAPNPSGYAKIRSRRIFPALKWETRCQGWQTMRARKPQKDAGFRLSPEWPMSE